nr:SURF1 family protein [Rhodoferax aquaticus]
MVFLLALALVLSGLSLGRWQLSRAEQKLTAQAAVEAQASKPALDNAQLLADTPVSHLYRSAVLRGQWIPGQTVLLDNRPMEGRVGFYVLTPFLLEGSKSSVMVQRGWIPRNFENRADVPQVASPTGVVVLVGRITPPPGALYDLGTQPEGQIRQNVDLKQFASAAGIDLLTEISVQQTDAVSGGLLQHWPVVNVGVDKHYGYAFQWFALAALIAGLYAWFQIIRPRISRPKD